MGFRVWGLGSTEFRAPCLGLGLSFRCTAQCSRIQALGAGEFMIQVSEFQRWLPSNSHQKRAEPDGFSDSSPSFFREP